MMPTRGGRASSQLLLLQHHVPRNRNRNSCGPLLLPPLLPLLHLLQSLGLSLTTPSSTTNSLSINNTSGSRVSNICSSKVTLSINSCNLNSSSSCRPRPTPLPLDLLSRTTLYTHHNPSVIQYHSPNCWTGTWPLPTPCHNLEATRLETSSHHPRPASQLQHHTHHPLIQLLLLTTLKTTPRRASQRQVPFAACTPKQATRSSQRWAAVPAVTTVASTMLWSLTLWTAMRGSMVNKAYDARHTYEAKET